jgi:hypothetical protein
VDAARKGAFFSWEALSLEQEKYFPPSSVVEYRMTKENRRMAKDQSVNFANGCPK